MMRVVWAVPWVLGVLACKSAAEPAPSVPVESHSGPSLAPPEKAAPAKAPAPATDRVEDPSFELAAVPGGPYAVGQLGSFAVSLKPRGEYHINQDYPITITVRPQAEVNLPRSEFKKADAAVFGEQLARFDVPLTPQQKGAQRLEANVRFAVCTPETCIPDERTLALVLTVK
jgi:hypothetical protein